MATSWTVPRDWVDKDAAIFASGPSMHLSIAESLKGKLKVIVVNDQFRLAPWADVLYAADFQWWNHRSNQDALDFNGLKVTVSFAVNSNKVLRLNPGEVTGLSYKADTLVTCKNSGFQAMNLAALFGVRRLFLFGFDMRTVDGKAHNFGNHPPGLTQDVAAYKEWVALVTKSAPEFARAGVEVFNCTKGSALKCFPFLTLEDVHARLSVSA
jgi:hypothetical protein